jgi:hypothetical protein
LDVLADLPAAAARVRICVEGTGSRTQGAGPDAYAVPGLPAGRPAVVTVDVLGDEDTGGEDARVVARVGPVTLDAATPWREAALETQGAAGPDPCTATGGFAPEGEDSWLLAVRFGR